MTKASEHIRRWRLTPRPVLQRPVTWYLHTLSTIALATGALWACGDAPSPTATILVPVSASADVNSTGPWNARADFSATENPNGTWSSGWKETPGGVFNLFTSVGEPEVGLLAWGYLPHFGLNVSGGDLYGTPAGYVLMHPGYQQYSVLRWTAPSTATYRVSATFLVGDRNGVPDFGDVDVHILRNGAEISPLYSALVEAEDASYTGDVALNAGEFVDFVVGMGGDYYFFDTTPIDVTISRADPGSTTVGTDVTVSPVDPSTGSSPVTLSFASVTAPGTTTVTSSSTGAPPPLAFKMGTPPVYYELETSASYSGAIIVCFDYMPTSFRKASNLRLFHGGASGGWTDITTSNDASGGKICGSVTSLSPFALAELSYDFTGFFQPVDNPGPTSSVVNTLKAGVDVTIKLYLGGYLGTNVLAAGSPASSAYACSSGTEDAVEETVNAGGSSFTYDSTAGQYVYVWKTDKSWAGTCRKLTVTLKDGTSRQALFKLTK